VPQYVIQVVVSGGATVGIKKIDDELRKTQASATALNRGLALIASTVSVGALIKLTDTYTTIQNKLKTVTSNQYQLQQAMSATFQAAQENRVSWESLAGTYGRIRRATENLWLSSKDVLDITDTLSKAIQLSGATTQETTSVLRQFGQALSKGKLNGDEFVSVMENSTEVAGILMKSLGVTRGELMRMSKAGQLTTSVIIKAFQEARTEIVDRFGKRIPTLHQQFETLKNTAVKFFGEAGQGSGVVRALGDAIGFLSDHFTAFATLLTTVVVGVAITRTIAALNALRLAALSNPFTAIAVGIAALAIAYDHLGESAEKNGEKIYNADLSMDGIDRDWKRISRDFEATAESIGLLARVIRASNPEFNKFSQLFAQIETIAKLGKTQMSIATTAAQTAAIVIGGVTEAVIKNVEAAVDAAEKYKALVKEFRAVEDQTDPVIAAMHELEDAQVTLNKAVAAGIVPLSRSVEIMQKLHDLKLDAPKVSGAQTQIQASQTLTDPTFARDQLILADADKVRAQSTDEYVAAMKRQAEVFDEIRGPAIEYQEKLDATDALLAAGKITIGEYTDEVKRLGDAYRQTIPLGNSFEDGVTAGLRRIGQEAANLGGVVEDALVSAFHKSEDALAEFLATGQFNFHNFAESLLQDISRVLARQLILGAVGLGTGAGIERAIPAGQAFFAGLGRAGGGSMFPSPVIGLAGGGDMIVPGNGGIDNRIMVARVSPGERVTVQNRGQQERAAPGAPVIVRPVIVNQFDPRESANAIGTPLGAREMINVVRKNPAAFRQATK